MSAPKRQPIPLRLVLTNPVCCLAFGFGAGLSPVAPGTAGTLAALPLYWLLAPLPLWAYLTLTAALFALGVWLCGRCEQILGVQDHSGIVWDEFVGLLVALAGFQPTAWTVLAGFLLFRLFDAVKPWPIRWLDRRVHGGFGIMLDDLAAGAMAWLSLAALTSWAGWPG